jgi:hypothetical protein
LEIPSTIVRISEFIGNKFFYLFVKHLELLKEGA